MSKEKIDELERALCKIEDRLKAHGKKLLGTIKQREGKEDWRFSCEAKGHVGNSTHANEMDALQTKVNHNLRYLSEFEKFSFERTEAEKAGLPTVAHEATRFDTGCRLDLIDPDFLEAMGHIMYVGWKKYGEDNWKKGLPGEKSGHNHAMKHLLEFRQGTPNDYGPPEMHYAQVAVNAMFQFYEEKRKRIAAGDTV